MAQLKDDCFAFGGELMKTAEALALLKERAVAVVEAESAPLIVAAGRILSADVVSPCDVPPHDNAAVDGYAVYFDDLSAEGETLLPVGARVTAGHPLSRPARRGEAVRIFTGAPMPAGDDGPGPETVLMQEDCRTAGEHIAIPPGIRRGANRRRRGEDIVHGATILERGHRLRPQDIGLAASVGVTELPVYRRLRVALFSTGDEICEPGDALPPGGIYDANRYTVRAALEGLGCAVTDLGILEDRFEPLRDALRTAAQGHDVVMTSGGVSTGEEDHVRAALEALGRIHFWRLAIRPGRPLALGQIGATPFVGLPGNPVAAWVTFLRFARPLVLGLAGAAMPEPPFFRVRADFDYKKKKGRREWLRARLHIAADGSLCARKFARDGAGILSSTVYADGLIEVAEEVTMIEAGSPVDFLPFSELA